MHEWDDAVALAAEVARDLVRPLGRRWVHVQRVAELARIVGEAFAADRDALVAAALLHDVGYAPGLAVTGSIPSMALSS